MEKIIVILAVFSVNCLAMNQKESQWDINNPAKNIAHLLGEKLSKTNESHDLQELLKQELAQELLNKKRIEKELSLYEKELAKKDPKKE